jgi:hypothetical protein
MSKHNRLSRDQKRKAKLAKQARRGQAHVSLLAYRGNKYKKDEYVPLVFATERAIHEVDVLADRQLTDAAVRAALEKLVLQLRHGPLSPLEEVHLQYVVGEEENLLADNIRRAWQEFFETDRPWSLDVQSGVLRTLLGSVETWSSPSPHSRGYLQFLEGFMKKAGVRIEAFNESGEALPGPEEDVLLELGRRSARDGDQSAELRFRELADERIRAGDADSVVDATQTLMGEFSGGSQRLIQELGVISIEAQQRIQSDLKYGRLPR